MFYEYFIAILMYSNTDARRVKLTPNPHNSLYTDTPYAKHLQSYFYRERMDEGFYVDHDGKSATLVLNFFDKDSAEIADEVQMLTEAIEITYAPDPPDDEEDEEQVDPTVSVWTWEIEYLDPLIAL